MTRMGVRAGLLRHRAAFHAAFRAAAEEHARAYGVTVDVAGELARYDALAPRAAGLLVDGVAFINEAYAAGKRIVTEGANAAMLDVDFGTYPYVTSSSTTAGGVATGLGLSPDKIDAAIGVVKAYTTRVGSGPFPTELTDARGGGDRPMHAPGTDIGLHMQTVGQEIGVTTGRKRRCGWFDAVVVQYAHRLNAFSSLNLTKLDILDDLSELKIGVAYSIRGQQLPYGAMPAVLEDLAQVEVVYETMPGWKAKTSGVRKWEELPENARKYIQRIEQVVGVPVRWVGTGPDRDDMVTPGFSLAAKPKAKGKAA
jgi:adenylosuccinate synthase